MAKQSCCHKKKLRRGLWSPEEDEKLMNHIAKYGHGCWSSVPKLAGLERCGKSCRLRWINYLRPDLKRGTFSQEEEDLIIQLHSMLGNKYILIYLSLATCKNQFIMEYSLTINRGTNLCRWSQIAAQLPGRTDNEVKNFWNSYIKKKLRDRGIDPATHKPLATDTNSNNSTSRGGARAAVFSDAELIPPPQPLVDTMQQQQLVAAADGLKTMPLDYWPSAAAGNGAAYHHHALAAAFDMDALSQHCGGVQAASSSSTLTSITGLSPAAAAAADADAGSLQPWLDLGHGSGNSGVVGTMDHYAGVLDELRWSDYFDGAFQAAAATTVTQGGGQCLYDGGAGKDVVVDDDVQFVDVHSLSNWC
uniref:Uncharacterized protein n=1 Tax=Leersia perrieri TaxID=77586 RepID=A0A0D9VUG4_9ORYZ